MNPDGSTGIKVITDIGQGGEFAGGNSVPGSAMLTEGVHGDEYASHKDANFAAERQGDFYYVPMAGSGLERQWRDDRLRLARDIDTDGPGTGDGLLSVLKDHNDWAVISPAGLQLGEGMFMVRETVACTPPLPASLRRGGR